MTSTRPSPLLEVRPEVHPATFLYLKHMAQKTGTHGTQEFLRLWSDPRVQPDREVVDALVHQCSRKKHTQALREQACPKCWRKAMHRVLFVLLHKHIAEIYEKSTTVIRLHQEGALSASRVLDLLGFFTQNLDQWKALLARLNVLFAKKRSKKKEWNRLVEDVHQHYLQMVNETSFQVYTGTALTVPTTSSARQNFL